MAKKLKYTSTVPNMEMNSMNAWERACNCPNPVYKQAMIHYAKILKLVTANKSKEHSWHDCMLLIQKTELTDADIVLELNSILRARAYANIDLSKWKKRKPKNVPDTSSRASLPMWRNAQTVVRKE